MPDSPNYVLGFGERLTEPIVSTTGGGPKEWPYTFEQARERILPMVEAGVEAIDNLPIAACPDDQSVARITLHPEFYARSYYPATFLEKTELRTVGSRPQTITPEKRSRGREPAKAVTTELFVAGARESFRQLSNVLSESKPTSTFSNNVRGIESFSAMVARDRIRSLRSDGESELPLEVVLHARENTFDSFIIAGFRDFLRELNLDLDTQTVFFSGGLCFLRLRATSIQAQKLAQYSFLRVVRQMPSLRINDPSSVVQLKSISLPRQDAVDSSLRVAIFDGGIRPTSPLVKWVTPIDAPNIGAADPEMVKHGEAVTSALLFGSIDNSATSRPPSRADHHRVLDDLSDQDPYQLFDVLERVKGILSSNNYDFINLSLGPQLAIDDDDVHAWTAVLDEYLSDGRTLATIAAGNTGDRPTDPVIQPWRVQVPADCVNALTVGAADRQGSTWAKSDYSSLGPGRSPGIVKPDLVVFGGSGLESFWTVNSIDGSTAQGTQGTSFAAPAALRCAIATRAHLGPVLTPLAIRTLLVHCTDPADHDLHEVGWGRISTEIADIILCPSASVRVIYQDEISPSQYRRIRLPLPQTGLKGKLTLTATFCFATEIDAGHPGNYTKSGLSIVFRPNKARFENVDSIHPKSESFFKLKEMYSTSQILRSDANKWETCLHSRINKMGRSLNEPVFDIHYHTRTESRVAVNANKIRYALVVTIHVPKVEDFYDQVTQTYRNLLQPLTPVIALPVQV